MTKDKKPKIIFLPGSFDNFEGTQEELDALIKELTDLVESGKLLKEATPVDDMDEDEFDDLMDLMEEYLPEKRTLQ